MVELSSSVLATLYHKITPEHSKNRRHSTKDTVTAMQNTKQYFTKVLLTNDTNLGFRLELCTSALPDMTSHDGMVRFVCLSDTHSLVNKMPGSVPDGDILIHAGDFTDSGTIEEVEKFNRYLGKLPHRYKIVIAGNHEYSFDDGNEKALAKRCSRHDIDFDKMLAYLQKRGAKRMQDLLTNCTYLEDSGINLREYGLKIWGSPWQPMYRTYDGSFKLSEAKQLQEKWSEIPDDIDILITHGPPYGFGDITHHGTHAGCEHLRNAVQHRVHPKFHIFGHIHDGYSVTTDNTTVFINASICTRHHNPTNPPIVFDVPKKGNVKKETLV